MRTIRTLALAPVAALVLAGACASEKRSSLPSPPPLPSTTGTSPPASTGTTRVAEALTAALLSPADVPESTSSAASPDRADISACFPGNPLGSTANPTEVQGPDLSLGDASGVQRQYSSSARKATPEQAAAFVSTFASPTGSACALDAYKAAINNDPKPPKFDAASLTGPTTTAAVGDGGAVLSVGGSLTSDSGVTPAEIDILVFHKGPVMVSVTVVNLGGPRLPGQAVDLATRIAGRLP